MGQERIDTFNVELDLPAPQKIYQQRIASTRLDDARTIR